MAVFLKEENGTAYIEFDQEDSKVNVLTEQTLRQFEKLLDTVSSKTSLNALVLISKKKDVFIAGADIKEIGGIKDIQVGEQKAKAGQDIFNKLEDLPIPTIAVIDGVALGGGCELALACQYRLSTFNEKVRIGLPEVGLGIMPGFGGTYRMPRVVGLSEGLKLILSARPIDSQKALKIGLVDRLVPQARLDHFIKEFVADVIEKKLGPDKYNRRKPKKGLIGFLEGNRIGHSILFDQSVKSVLKLSKGFYPAPLRAIAAIKQNFYTDRARGMAIERQEFGKLSVTDVSKNLIHVFYISEKYRKLSVDGAENITPQEIKKCGVLGAGVMGGGIAQLLSSREIWVRLKDINHDAVAKGFQAAWKIYSQAVEKRILTKTEAARKMAKVTGTLDYNGFRDADIIIEAVVEKMEIKKKVFKELSQVVADRTILATNTSALSVAEMAKETKDPSKVIGFHFFNPVHRMPLVEIITSPQTSKETTIAALNLAKRLGKTPILVKDSCGFLVNRILLGYINEAGRLLEETRELEKIDGVMTDFGMPMGPFTLSDEVGLDVGVKVMHILHDAFGERFKPADIFEEVFKKGFLGKKSGKGFYVHEQRRMTNFEVFRMLKRKRSAFDEGDCRDRLILPMVNEAAMCLQEGIIPEAAAVDVGMIFGTGFPAFRGGLLRYADQAGVSIVVDKLKYLAEKYDAPRFKPCRYLLELSSRNKGFFA